MKRLCLACALSLVLARLGAAPAIRLPGFPAPPLVVEDGEPAEITSVRLLRDMFRGDVHGIKDFDTVDADYVLLRGDSLNLLAAWLEAACEGVHFNLRDARDHEYDGTVFARLLDVAASLGTLQAQTRPFALPIGLMICRRTARWGELPSDGRDDAYIIVDTDVGMLVYDPPTRQLSPLSDFPNKESIRRIRF